MQRRVLGSSGIEISTIGLGNWAIGGHMWGGQDDAKSAEAIHAAVDHGINWIDTAPIYGSGHSEEVVGRAVKQLPPGQRPLIFTKFGLGADSDVRKQRLSPAEVQAECDGSLRRLGIERIDLYQLHWPAPQPIAETAAACEALMKAGKIRAIGVSHFWVAQLEEWQGDRSAAALVQPPFSILRPAVKENVLPWCAAHGVGAIWYSPLFRGLLFGRLASGQVVPGRTMRAARTRTMRACVFSATCRRSTRSARSPRSGGLSVPQLCVGVLLRTPGLTAVIAGARNAQQGGVIAALGVSVTDQQANEVWGIVERLAEESANM